MIFNYLDKVDVHRMYKSPNKALSLLLSCFLNVLRGPASGIIAWGGGG